MRIRLPLLFFLSLPALAQGALVSVIRQPRATLAEFTVPITDLQVRDQGDFARLHLGVGLGLRHWDDGDSALRFIADANASAHALFAGLGVVMEARPGDGVFLGPRLRIGRSFSQTWALSLEAEHLEKPFSPGLSVHRRSSLGLALTARF